MSPTARPPSPRSRPPPRKRALSCVSYLWPPLSEKNALPSDLFAEVGDRLADFPATFADGFLDPAGSFIFRTFVAQTLVVAEIASGLFGAALRLIDLAAHFFLVPHDVLLLLNSNAK